MPLQVPRIVSMSPSTPEKPSSSPPHAQGVNWYKILACSFLALYLAYHLRFLSYHLGSVYQLGQALSGVKQLFELPQEKIDACLAAYKHMQNGTSDLAGATTNAEDDIEHIRKYYEVLQPILRIADIEKMYIPPQIDPSVGLYENQILNEIMLFDKMNSTYQSRHQNNLSTSIDKLTILDIGCGSGRIAHHAADYFGTDAHVSGFNIGADQIDNAREYAKETGFENRLSFKVGDNQKRFEYKNAEFDMTFDMGALWVFTKLANLDAVSSDLFRVLKPGGVYGCFEYLLTPQLEKTEPEHMELHRLYMPCLAASASNYPKDVTDALQRAGFELIYSRPSIAPAYPLTEQKTELIEALRSMVTWLNYFGLMPDWTKTLIENVLEGGHAWTLAEKRKIADLNWGILVRKPL